MKQASENLKKKKGHEYEEVQQTRHHAACMAVREEKRLLDERCTENRMTQHQGAYADEDEDRQVLPFQKGDGSLREAYGTLATSLIPATAENNRRKNDTVQVYYDTEKEDWRCFKKANLIKIA